jgi:glycerol-3-phosphate acyltransferase PlsY
MFLSLLLYVIFGYCAGSVPFGLAFAKILKLGDLRKIGSGNVGTTNVLRTGSKTAALLTLLCDALKGCIPVWLYIHSASSTGEHINVGVMAVAFAALLGHIFPIFAKFRGGKGVATTIGINIAISPFCAVVLVTTWVVTFLFSKFSSLSALVAICIVCPIVSAGSVFLGAPPLLFCFSFLCGVISAATHYQNIKRLLSGMETKSSLS